MRKLSIALALSAALAARADDPHGITPGELSRLPEYCPDTIAFELRGSRSSPTERQRRWAGMMGEPFWGLHHYCWALVWANRAHAAGVPPAQRQHMLTVAIADIYYVIQLSSREFPLLPELLTRAGQYFVELNKPIEAIEHFERSREIKPDYWPPYLGLADLNMQLGRKQQALDALNAGLKLMPDEPRLKEALSRIERTKPRAAGKRPKAAASQPPA